MNQSVQSFLVVWNQLKITHSQIGKRWITQQLPRKNWPIVKK